MHVLYLFIAFIGIQTLVFNGFSVLACWLMKVDVKKFVVFRGPKLVWWHAGGCEVSLRLLPIGGYVEHDMEMLQARSLWQRVLMSLSGLLGTTGMGLALLGAAPFLHYVQSTLVHLIPGTLHPMTVGAECVARVAEISVSSFWSGLGAAVAVSVALNLLPIPMTPLCRTIFEIFGFDFSETTGKNTHTAAHRLIVVGCLLLMVVHAVWFVAIGTYIYRLMA